MWIVKKEGRLILGHFVHARKNGEGVSSVKIGKPLIELSLGRETLTRREGELPEAEYGRERLRETVQKPIRG